MVVMRTDRTMQQTHIGGLLKGLGREEICGDLPLREKWCRKREGEWAALAFKGMAIASWDG